MLKSFTFRIKQIFSYKEIVGNSTFLGAELESVYNRDSYRGVCVLNGGGPCSNLVPMELIWCSVNPIEVIRDILMGTEHV